MIINIENIDQMQKDLSNILNITQEELKKTILRFDEQSRKGCIFDEDKFIELSEKFITTKKKFDITEIYICHLTRHIGEPEKLFPLQQLLTEENEFSKFLEGYDIRFNIEDNHILINHKGKEIDKKNIYDKDSYENEYARLATRLGYIGQADYCVNGFLFAIDIKNSTDIYYMYLMQGPELLQDLDDFFLTNMHEVYKTKSKYYASIIKVPLQEIIFDGRANFNVSSNKDIKYIILCFMFLQDYYINAKVSYNEAVRLGDYESVKVDHNILISK